MVSRRSFLQLGAGLVAAVAVPAFIRPEKLDFGVPRTDLSKSPGLTWPGPKNGRIYIPSGTWTFGEDGNLQPVLVGDGIHDDGPALQWMLDNHGHIVKPMGIAGNKFRVITLEIKRDDVLIDGGGATFIQAKPDEPIFSVTRPIHNLHVRGADQQIVRGGFISPGSQRIELCDGLIRIQEEQRA